MRRPLLSVGRGSVARSIRITDPSNRAKSWPASFFALNLELSVTIEMSENRIRENQSLVRVFDRIDDHVVGTRRLQTEQIWTLATTARLLSLLYLGHLFLQPI